MGHKVIKVIMVSLDPRGSPMTPLTADEDRRLEELAETHRLGGLTPGLVLINNLTHPILIVLFFL